MARKPGRASTPGELRPPLQIPTPDVLLDYEGMPIGLPTGPPHGFEESNSSRLFNEENVGRWLAAQPSDGGDVVGARAALRAIPALGSEARTVAGDVMAAESTFILPVFRAVSAAWIKWVARYSNELAAGISFAEKAMSEIIKFHQTNAALAANAAMYGREANEQPKRALQYRNIILAVSSSANAAFAIGDVDHRSVAGFEILRAAAEDARFPTSDGALHPLWPGGMPDWSMRAWHQLKGELLGLNDDWSVWTDWYEQRLNGGPVDESLEVARVQIADEIWEQGPRAVNAEIARLIEQFRAPPKTDPPPPHEADPAPRAVLDVPAQRPAALEPVWEQGKITLPQKPAKTGLSKKKFADALAALRSELHDFSEAIAGEANIDRRFVTFVQGLPARIPDKHPSNEELFRLGHLQERLAAYAKTVEQEWPAFLASGFHALVIHYDRTMRQSPVWCEFKRNAAQQTLTAEQIAAAPALATEAARALRDQEFVDPAVPEALEQLADALHVAEPGHGTNGPDVIEAGKELLAADIIESVNNILKRTAEVALPLAVIAGRRAGSTTGKVAKEYVDRFEESAVAEAGKIADKDGGLVVRWLHRFAIAAAVGGFGGLIAQFPAAFQWLTYVLKFFQSLPLP